MNKKRLNQLLGATLVIWGILLLCLINSCTDDCESGYRCNGASMETCVSGEWHLLSDCGDKVDFNFDPAPMQCCDLGAGDAECRENCE